MRIVQIGLDRWGQKNSEYLSKLGVLSGVFDNDFKKAKEIGEKYSVKPFESIEELVSSKDFDAACIDSSFSNPWELISNLLYDKKHVFVEKLITSKTFELEKLHEILQKKKSFFSCGFDQRYNEALQQVKQITNKKEFGELVSLELYREVPLQNKSLVFQSCLYDIDALNQIFGMMPIFVFSRLYPGEDEKFANIVLGYPENKSAVILSNGFSDKEMVKLKAIYPQKTVFADLVTHKIEGIEVKEIFDISPIENFIGAIEGKNELEVDSNQMVSITKIAEAALLSSKQGVPIYLDLK